MNTSIIADYKRSRARLFMFDYDGTLAELAPTPPEAAPTQELLDILEALANDPANTVVIVSGRERGGLDEWLGHLPVALVAEHGFWRRERGGPWAQVHQGGVDWQDDVRILMQQFVTACPGSFIEEKASGLGWHYRTVADTKLAELNAGQLRTALDQLETDTPIRVIDGDKIIEVQPEGNDKGAAAQHWLQENHWDFIMAAGDDTTDEDMLAAVPPSAYTIKVGERETCAKLKLAHPKAMRQLLRELTAASS